MGLAMKTFWRHHESKDIICVSEQHSPMLIDCTILNRTHESQ
jgi:hypothetical protein